SAASPRLAELRGEIKRSEAEIQHALRRVLESPGVRKALQSSQVAWRNRRPVLHVKAESRKLVRGIVHDRSQSGQTVFIEPEAVVEPSNRLGALEAAENAEVQRILAELLRVLLGKLDEVGLALEGLAWIDFTAARARLVMELGFVVPELAGAASFRLRAARHPLLLLDVWLGKRSAADVQEEAVPLDLDLGDPSWVLVVTGPNTGGKTVALKTLGLITLMAQAGLPVPAGSGTALPFVDGIFADIGDEQAIAQNLSTFSSHMTRITRLLEQATPESLVLLDELGAGTEPEEGGALGYAILEALHERRVRTMASTHLSRLKDFAYQHAGSENGAMAFDPDSLRPLFRLEIGVPGSSNALHIARAVGVQNRIVDRAAEILGERDRSIDEMIDRIQRTRRAAEAERRVAEITKMRVEGEELEVREKAEELSQKEAWLREEAQHLVDEELRAARDLLADPLKQFLNAPAPYGEVASGMLKLLHGLLSRSTLGRRRRSFLERIRKGHMVYVPHFSRRCRVTKVDRKREILELEVGDLRMNLPFDDVSWLQPLDSK
ncbi:MAG: endonuclease MutS2, partial [Planctomycetota bacterium]